MGLGKFKIFFDDRDYKLLDIVNAVMDRKESFSHLNDLLYPHLHPHGIKEIAESRGLRIAYAITHLLGSLGSAKADERVSALRSLRDEVLNSADSHMRRNTARVLLQVMKELIQTRGDRMRGLELAHDFFAAVSGKPRIIRKLLREHHLLEMPEEWNQAAFDGHVHDSYTKGRKSPSHLVMDAWIKGIRCLTIIYYNHVDPGPVAELLESAETMQISVRVGVEFPAKFQDKTIHLIWAPRGFSDAQDFLSFLHRPDVEQFMQEGRKVSEYRQQQVLVTLAEFNEKHRPVLTAEFGLEVAPLDGNEYVASVKTGQLSILHLAKFIHAGFLPAMQARVEQLRELYGGAGPSERKTISELIDRMNSFDSETIVERFLRSEAGFAAQMRGHDLPELLRLSPEELIARLNQLHSGFRLTLNLTNLRCEDVLELLHDCGGAITHLEIFNLKDHMGGKAPDYGGINELQQVVNSGDTLKLIRIIRKILRRMKADEATCSRERTEKFEAILQDPGKLIGCYRNLPLGSILGSDSTGHSHRSYGMGFVVEDTLPGRAQRNAGGNRRSDHLRIPVKIRALQRTTFIPRNGRIGRMCGRFLQLFVSLPVLSQKIREWEVENHSIELSSSGNIVALGGVRKTCNGFYLKEPVPRSRPCLFDSWRYLNGVLKNTIKIAAGFIPSMITFMYTQQWWFLIYLGTPIWFAITGLRNVVQSVFGGGGLKRSPLLGWNSYVSWDRMSDSLLYTGLSVPLLEYLIRVLLLERTCGITTTTNPVMLYTVMSVVNGAYISGHNVIRGLPREAIVGNFFRSILNIPLSIGLNSALSGILGACGAVAVNDILQQWAAIIAKLSSDCVAGIIEGFADRRNYFRTRIQDYRAKIGELFATYEDLEILYPQFDVLEMLEANDFPSQKTNDMPAELQKVQIVNALDLLYFWMYQPRARTICVSLLKKMSFEELQIFIRSQAVLCRRAEIARLFVDGLVGENWSKAMAFYLSNYPTYLDSLENIYESLSTRINVFRQLLLSSRRTIRFLAAKAKERRQWSLIHGGSRS
jgi:hypothetical protein